MKTSLHNQQKKVPLCLKSVRRLTRWLAAEAATRSPARWHEASVVLTDDAGITPLNRRFFGKDHPTDVISFALDTLPGEAAGLRGEIFVNVERARLVGRRPDASSRELALYIAHGFNHLSGATDHTARERAAMRRRELAWLRRAARLGYLQGLVSACVARRRPSS